MGHLFHHLVTLEAATATFDANPYKRQRKIQTTVPSLTQRALLHLSYITIDHLRQYLNEDDEMNGAALVHNSPKQECVCAEGYRRCPLRHHEMFLLSFFIS